MSCLSITRAIAVILSRSPRFVIKSCALRVQQGTCLPSSVACLGVLERGGSHSCGRSLSGVVGRGLAALTPSTHSAARRSARSGALTAETSSSRSGAGRGAGGGAAMDCGAAPAPGAYSAAAGTALSPTERSPAKSGLHVNFSDKGEVKERREKFLTAKYGSHQMALIRKRLAVEMWLYDELQQLYEPAPPPVGGGAAGAGGAREVEVDIDELLDMDSDDQRRAHLKILLADAKKPSKDVYKFINDLLEKAKTL